jgi:hypothetical protein
MRRVMGAFGPTLIPLTRSGARGDPPNAHPGRWLPPKLFAAVQPGAVEVHLERQEPSDR